MKEKYSMLKTLLPITAGIIFIFLGSCKEVGPNINLTETVYTTYLETPEAPQSKMVLIEDFTGAACPNCPDAHIAIADAIAAHPGAIAAIAEYNYFSDPLYIEQNMVTDEALNLNLYYLGIVSGWPASFMDRVDFDGDNYLPEPPANVLPYTEEQLTKIPPCNIYITKNSFDAVTRVLSFTVTVKYTTAVTELNHLSVSLTESNIIAAQIDDNAGGEVPDYVHNHVLRKMSSYYLGDALPEENVAGRVYIFNYSDTLPVNWNEANMEAIAFVHNFETGNKEVLQTASLPLE